MRRHVLYEGKVTAVEAMRAGHARITIQAEGIDGVRQENVLMEDATGAFDQPARVVVEVGAADPLREMSTADIRRATADRRDEELWVKAEAARDRLSALVGDSRQEVATLKEETKTLRAALADEYRKVDALRDEVARSAEEVIRLRDASSTNEDLARLIKDREAVSARYGALLDVLATNVAGLPADLSAFPATDRAQIAEGLREVNPDPATWVRLDDVIALCAGQVARVNRELAKGRTLLEDAARLRGERGIARWIAVNACPPESDRSGDAQIATGVFSGGPDVAGIGPVRGPDETDTYPPPSDVKIVRPVSSARTYADGVREAATALAKVALEYLPASPVRTALDRAQDAIAALRAGATTPTASPSGPPYVGRLESELADLSRAVLAADRGEIVALGAATPERRALGDALRRMGEARGDLTAAFVALCAVAQGTAVDSDGLIARGLTGWEREFRALVSVWRSLDGAVKARDGAMDELRVLRQAVLAVSVPQDFDNVSVRRLCGDAVAGAMARIAIGMVAQSSDIDAMRAELRWLRGSIRNAAAGNVVEFDELAGVTNSDVVEALRALVRQKTIGAAPVESSTAYAQAIRDAAAAMANVKAQIGQGSDAGWALKRAHDDVAALRFSGVPSDATSVATFDPAKHCDREDVVTAIRSVALRCTCDSDRRNVDALATRFSAAKASGATPNPPIDPSRYVLRSEVVDLLAGMRADVARWSDIAMERDRFIYNTFDAELRTALTAVYPKDSE